MSSNPPASPARRDAGLRRLRAFNRVLIGGAVGLTAGLTAVAARAFPGSTRRVVATSAAIRPATANRPGSPHDNGHSRSPRRHRIHPDRRSARPLTPPAQPPSPGTAAPPQPSSAPAPQAAQTTSPSPVTSGGS